MKAYLRNSICCVGAVAALRLVGYCRTSQDDTAKHKAEEPTLTLSLRHASFSDVLQALNSRNAVRSISDGIPIRQAADVEIKAPLHQALDAIASLYDLTWSATKSGVILFKKRFTDEHDHPQLIPAELSHVASDELTILPDTGDWIDDSLGHEQWGVCMMDLWQSLSSSQLEALQAGKRVASSDLTPQQYDFLNRALVSRAFGPARTYWLRISNVMTGIKNSKITSTHLDSAGPFGNILTSSGAGPIRHTISHVATGQSGQTIETPIVQSWGG